LEIEKSKVGVKDAKMAKSFLPATWPHMIRFSSSKDHNQDHNVPIPEAGTVRLLCLALQILFVYYYYYQQQQHEQTNERM